MATQTHPAGSAPAGEAEVGTTASQSSRPRVVVLGGGVAGLTAAYELHRRLRGHAEITLVSESEQFSLGPALVWLPFGGQTWRGNFLLSQGLERHGIRFVHASATHVDPARRSVSVTHLGRDTELPYEYLIIATGPRADGTAIPGVAGQFNATTSIWSEAAAQEAKNALESFLEQPGPVVVGAAPGAAYLSAAYEFALSLDDVLRRRGTRAQAPITFVTPELYLGHLDIGASAPRRALERLFARRGITPITGAVIARVDRAGVHLQDGRTLAAAYTMILPPFSGVTGIWKSEDLTATRGFVPVDAQYRHVRYAEIYAVGVAARAAIISPALAGLPQTGYLASAMAKAAVRNVAAAITGQAPARRGLPRLLDLRLIDGGDAGLLLLTAEMGRPLSLAVPLPGRTAHRAKGLLVRYLLWKLRTGRAYLP